MGGSDRDSAGIDGENARTARAPDLIQLAGSVSVPSEKRGKPWDEVLRETWRVRAAARR